MKDCRAFTKLRALLGFWLFLWAATAARSAETGDSILPFEPFGTVHLYRQSAHPARVVLFISSENGWNQEAVDMAQDLAGLDALVVGIDFIYYLKSLDSPGEGCLYPAAEFEALSKYVQKWLDYPEYIQPVLAGYSAGATLVYAVLAQAPANTFKAALSLEFNPDLTLARPLCKAGVLDWTREPQNGEYSFLPAARLENPWVVFQGESARPSSADRTRAFVNHIAGAEWVMVPRANHSASVFQDFLPHFKQVFERLTASQSQAVNDKRPDLPLVEVPAAFPARPEMAVLITGDGGWAGFDQNIAGKLAANGVAVVGLNSLKYFWTARTPEGASRDLAQILGHYLIAWKKEKAMLIGYSLGADVLPFMVARLPADIRQRIALIALLAPSRQTAFEFHLSDWIGGSAGKEQYATGPEVSKLTELPLLCFYGKEENESLCRAPLPPKAAVIPMPGGHHLSGDADFIVGQALGTLKRPYR